MAAEHPAAEHRTWRTWQLVTGMAVAFFLGIGAGATSTEDEQTTVAAQDVPPTTSPAATTSPTTLPPTTLAVTTTAVRASREAQLSAYAEAFERNRVSLAEAIQRDNPVAVSSVDRFEFDRSGPTVILSVSSSFSTPEFQRNVAWSVTKGLVPLWEASTIAGVRDAIPRFRLTVGSVRYECPHDFMVRLAELRAAREDWEAACRVG